MVCNTPYQLFNAINILSNDVNIEHSNCDILLDNTFGAFKNEKLLGERVIARRLCRRVFYATKKNKKQKRNKIKTFIYLLRNNHLEDYFFSDNSFLNIKYDYIWVGDGNPFGYSMYEKNRNTKVVWYDDGISSYASSPRNFGHSFYYEIIMKIFRFTSYKYDPYKIFVNNTELAQTKDFEICSLPVWNENNPATNNIEYVFGYDINSSITKEYNTIVLGQLLNVCEGYNGKNMLELICDAGIAQNSIIVRKHPRDKEQYNNYNIDSGHNIWELECIKGISSSHTLISAFSTALLTPKLVGRKEPYIILLYKLLFDESSSMIGAIDEIVVRMKKMYSDPNKIFVPLDLEELKSFLSKR